MKTKLLWIAALSAAMVTAVVMFLPKGEKTAPVDPAFYHTAEGVNFRIQELREVFSQALKDRNLQLIHDQMYYVEGLADALSEKLDGEKKRRVASILAELKRVAEETDHFAGRKNQPGTAASLEKLFEIMNRLDAEFKTSKR